MYYDERHKIEEFFVETFGNEIDEERITTFGLTVYVCKSCFKHCAVVTPTDPNHTKGKEYDGMCHCMMNILGEFFTAHWVLVEGIE